MTDPQPISDDLLHAYIDGQLDAAQATVVEFYLSVHPNDALRFDAYSRHRRGLRQALRVFAEQDPSQTLSISRLARERRAARQAPLFRAAAAALIFALGGAGGWILRGWLPVDAGNSVASISQEAVQNHIVFAIDAGRPVEWKTDTGEGLVGWLSRRLNRPLRVPDLDAAGYRLMGGRLVATDLGPAALLMYDDKQGNRLTVFTRPTTRPRQDTRTVAVGKEPIDGYAWICGGLGYVVLAPSRTPGLQDVAALVRKQVDPT